MTLLRNWKNRWRRRKLAKLGVDVEVSLTLAPFGIAGGSWTVWPQPLDAGSLILSFGAGTDISFDLAIASRTGATVHIFDPTPRSVAWMQQQSLPANVFFHDIGIAGYDGELTFHAPRREQSSHFSPVKRYRGNDGNHNVVCTVETLDTICSRFGTDKVSLCKMDIEGGEYDVLPDILGSDVQIDQIAMEFHHAYDTIPLKSTLDAIENLRNSGFVLAHISERTYEMLFVHQHCIDRH